MAGRRKQEMVDIRMRVSARLYDYLSYLCRHTIIGGSENDAAAYLLTKQLESMMARKYHETEIPPSEEDEN